MERARVTWTDERLDDLSRHVNDGFGRFDRLEGRFDRLEGRFDRLEDRFDRLQAVMIQLGGGAIVTTLATLVTLLVTR